MEHHSWPVSYDILRHKIERYKLRAEVAWRESAWHVKRSEDSASEMAVTGEHRRASRNTKAETQPAQLPKVVYYPCRGPVSGRVCYEIHCETKCSCSLLCYGACLFKRRLGGISASVSGRIKRTFAGTNVGSNWLIPHITVYRNIPRTRRPTNRRLSLCGRSNRNVRRELLNASRKR